MAEKKLPKGITLRKDGIYVGRFTFRGERKVFYDTDIKKLEKKMSDAKYEMEHGTYRRPEKMTYEEWFQIWINDYKKNDVKDGTIDLYKVCYESYIKPFLARLKLSEINGTDIDRVFQKMANKGLKKGTMNIVKVILKSSLKLAVRKDLIAINPVDKADIPKKEKRREMRVLSMKEQEVFMKYAASNPYYYVYYMALNTGMRSGELRALKWENVNFQKKEIYVVGTLKYSRTEKRYYIDLPKTKTSLRTIPMAEKVCGIMKQVKKLQLEQKMKLGELWRQKKEFEDLVFTNEVGDIISHDCLNVNVKKIVKQINRDIEKEAKENHQQPEYFRSLTPHTLRHSFATNMIALGMEPKTLSTILGHATLAQTMDLYVHISNEMRRTELEKAYKKMEDMELVQ